MLRGRLARQSVATSAVDLPRARRSVSRPGLNLSFYFFAAARLISVAQFRITPIACEFDTDPSIMIN